MHYQLCKNFTKRNIMVNLYKPKNDFDVSYIIFSQGEHLWDEGKRNVVKNTFTLC